MNVACGSRALGRHVGKLVIAVAVAAACLPSSAGAAEGPDVGPPTAAEFKRLTAAFLGAPGASTRGSRGGGGVGSDPEADPDPGADPPLLGGGIAVALYGAPQLTLTAVGKRSPSGAARKLRKQAAGYARSSSLPVRRSINLIGVIATATPGSDGKYRSRQPDSVIRKYLKAARSVSGRLTLDIQPGRSPVMRELKALRSWIKLPDVDVGIDPEWNVGRKGVPGRDDGSITAKQLNRASKWIERVVEQEGLPPKAMIVHQFRAGSIKQRRRIKARAGAEALLNFDGIGGRKAKKAGYANLATPGLANGFSLFYDRDKDLMRPRAVLRLRPRASYAMYQ